MGMYKLMGEVASTNFAIDSWFFFLLFEANEELLQ